MDINIEKYNKDYLFKICDIWNETIDEGVNLPWKEPLTEGKTEYIINTQIGCYCAVNNKSCIGVLYYNFMLNNNIIVST